MSFPRYPKYKDSGVEWLGEVPEHWKIDRLKRACHVFPSNVDKKSYDGETPITLCNYTDVYYNDLITQAIEFMPVQPLQIKSLSLRFDPAIRSSPRILKPQTILPWRRMFQMTCPVLFVGIIFP